MQDKSKLGNRYTCFQCGQKFYDLLRPLPLCPKCGANQSENPAPDPREAILARFKGKGKTRFDDAAEDEEEVEEVDDIDEPDDIDEDEEEAGEPAEADEED